MKPVVVFGDGQLAELASFYVTHDTDRIVAAHTVDGGHLQETSTRGVPIVAFEEVRESFPPSDFDMFVAIGYSRMNRIREQKYQAAKDLGYDLMSYVSSKAVVWPGVTIGDNCFIMEQNVIQPLASVGNDVIMFSGCQIAHGSAIGDHSFFSAHVVVSGNVVVEPNCFFGVNATLRDSITIGRESVIGASALIMRSTAARSVYAAPKAQLLAMTSDRLPSL